MNSLIISWPARDTAILNAAIRAAARAYPKTRPDRNTYNRQRQMIRHMIHRSW